MNLGLKLLPILMILALTPLAAAQQNTYVERILEVNPYGLLYVHDTVPRTGETTYIAFPADLVKYLVNYRSPEDPEPELEVGETLFYIKVRSASGDSVHLITVFKDVVARTPEGAFSLKFPLNPIISEKVDKVYFRALLPRDADVEEYEPEFLEMEEAKLGELRGESGEIDTSSPMPTYFSTSFRSRNLRIAEILEARLRVEYPERLAALSIKLRNGGGRDISSITMRIPAGSELIEARDLLGKIGSDYKPEEGRLRLSLRRPIPQGESQTLEAVFKLPEDTLIRESDGNLNLGLILPINATARIYEVELILESAEFLSSTPEPEGAERLYPERVKLIYMFDHVDPFNFEKLGVEVSFRKLPGRFALMPYLWGAALAAIVFGTASSVYLRRRAKAAVEGADKPLLELVEEGDAMGAACQRVADLITTRRILDKGYVRPRILELRSSIRRHAGKISALSGEVRKLRPELAEKVKALSESARRIEEEVESLWVATHNYLTGSMGRSAFRRVAEEHYKRLEALHKKLAEELEALRAKLP